ncbi:Uncharacterised protein [Bordetella pertussis]|nr:Uncharacterised protein [Bordetella pertussis]
MPGLARRYSINVGIEVTGRSLLTSMILVCSASRASGVKPLIGS